MGGKGSGGRRVGSGRKPQNQSLAALKGSRRGRARANAKANQNTANQNDVFEKVTPSNDETIPPSADTLEILMAPGNLTLDELGEWNELAPLALKEGTLTPATRLALRDLCQARVLKDKLLRQVGDHGEVVLGVGGNLAANPLLARFTTLLQRVDAGMMRFKLSPIGKEIDLPTAKPADPFSEFDAPANSGDRPGAVN